MIANVLDSLEDSFPIRGTEIGYILNSLGHSRQSFIDEIILTEEEATDVVILLTPYALRCQIKIV